jgi:SH3 domain-containing YSC84-like protein 1
MNDHGMQKLLQDKVSLGAEAAVAAGPVGRTGQAATDAQMHAEILSYSRAQGLFAGVDLSGGVLKADKDDNRDFYGKDISARDVLLSPGQKAPASAAIFMQALRHE